MIDVKNASNNGMNCLNGSYPLTIEAGDQAGISEEQWLGPTLSGTAGIPITVKGTITGNDIKLNITIPFMSMNIAVQFSGTKK